MRHNKKGFTLAELLIVVAIVGVLTAIAIPVFSAQLEKVRLAVDHANIRTVASMVALANQTGVILVDGEVITLKEAHDGIPYYSLTNSGTLTAFHIGSGFVSDDVYLLQATGVPEGGEFCPECPVPPLSIAGTHEVAMNRLHKKGNSIYVTVALLGDTYIAFLGYDVGSK